MKRRHSDEEKDTHSSPSGSSSHGEGGMADTETDTGRGQPPAGPSQVPPRQAEHQQEDLPSPPKKKRTRTLTTPHQSAVLHALLAQSRFPTTAMREEVGRSIGLSARKVQVWFQNQRQKARRPRSQSTATPLARPPQYGPYSSAPPTADPSGSQFAAGPSHFGSFSFTQSGSQHPNPDPERASQHLDPASRPEVNAYLSGPGVPGPSTQLQSLFYHSPTSHSPAQAGPLAAPWNVEGWSPHERRSSGSSRGRGQSLSPHAGRGFGMHPPSQEYPIHLPPLVFDESMAHRRRASSGFPPLPAHTLPSTSSAMHHPYDSPFTHHPPGSGSLSLPGSSSHTSRTLPRLHIPPSYSHTSGFQLGASSFSPIASLQHASSSLPTPPGSGSAPEPARFHPIDSPIGWRAPSPPLSSGPSTYTFRDSGSNVYDPRGPSPPARTTRFDPVRDAQTANDAVSGPSSVGTGEERPSTGSPTPRAGEGDDDAHDRDQQPHAP